VRTTQALGALTAAASRAHCIYSIFYEIKNRGYLDPLITLAKIQHESENESVRANAAAALAPYTHPKLQSLPVPRYIENPIEVPEFTSVEVAEQFLAKITTLLAAGQLDLDFADSLTKTTVGWIQSQYAKQGIDLKAQAQGACLSRPLHLQVPRVKIAVISRNGMLNDLPTRSVR
jgi:hypothetical protein